VASTVNQVMALAGPASELVRVTSIPRGRRGRAEDRRLRAAVRGSRADHRDFHYNGHILLKKYPACARALSKYRINPGNVISARSTTTISGP